MSTKSSVNWPSKTNGLPADTGQKSPKNIIRTEELIVNTTSGEETITRAVLQEANPEPSDLDLRLLYGQ